MSNEQVIRLIAFSGLIGFVVFCASYSYVVWRRRNKAAGNASGKLRSWFVTSIVFGLLAVATAYAIREAVSSEGTVVTDGFTVARAAEGGIVKYVHPEGDVKAGTVLVRFDNPELDAKYKTTQVALQAQEKLLEALPLKPLEADPELQRLHNLAKADIRSFQDRLNNLLSSHNTAVRELATQLTTSEDALAKIDGDIVTADNELKQAEIRHKITKEQLDRDLSARVGVIPLNEINDRQEKVANLATEIVKLKGRRANLDVQRKQMVESIAHFKSLTTKENSSFTAQEQLLTDGLKKAQTEFAALDTKLNNADKNRAEQQRTKEHEQLTLAVEKLKLELAGLQSQVEVKAAHDGRVFYTHPSGAAAATGVPVVVAGPSDGFRFRVKMTTAQADAMQTADEVTLDVGESQLARKFAAQYRTKYDLPSEPGYVIAELQATNPPAEAVKVMAEKADMKARLIWRFPLLTFWPFRIGLLLLAVGVGGLLLTSAFTGGVPAKTSIPSSPSIRIPTTPSPTPLKMPAAEDLVPLPIQEAELVEPMYAEAIPVSEASETVVASDVRDLIRKDPIIVHSAESGALLELLAIRLREAIFREHLEADLVESAEWAVQHHGQRALRVFRQVFRQDNRYVPHVEVLLERLEVPSYEDAPTVVQQRDLTRRTARILEQIGHRFLNPIALA